MLAQPLTLPNGVVLKNRLAKSAMEEDLGNLGVPGRGLDNLYRTWSQGGAGLLITGNVMIDKRSLTDSRAVILEDDSYLDRFRDWAAAGKSGGSKLIMQISNPGRQIPKFISRQPIAPSAVGMEVPGGRGLFNTPRALTGAEVEEQIGRYIETARLAVKAGFDGVQLHGAHGYLISQFLSPLTNRREDQWGGSLEKRAQFLFEIMRGVREVLPADRILAIKLNSADFMKGGFGEDDALWVIEQLNEMGLDLLELSGGTYEAPAMVNGKDGKPSAREAYFLDFADKARMVAKMPIMVTGGFHTSKGIEAALASGALDIAGMAKPFTVMPDLANRMVAGEDLRVAWPVKKLKNPAMDSMSQLGWARRQIHRMAGNMQPDLNIGTVSNLLHDIVIGQYHAWRYRRWLSRQINAGTGNTAATDAA